MLVVQESVLSWKGPEGGGGGGKGGAVTMIVRLSVASVKPSETVSVVTNSPASANVKAAVAGRSVPLASTTPSLWKSRAHANESASASLPFTMNWTANGATPWGPNPSGRVRLAEGGALSLLGVGDGEPGSVPSSSSGMPCGPSSSGPDPAAWSTVPAWRTSSTGLPVHPAKRARRSEAIAMGRIGGCSASSNIGVWEYGDPDPFLMRPSWPTHADVMTKVTVSGSPTWTNGTASS
jgi:hypothetical protein